MGIEFDGAGVVLDGPGQVALGRAGEAAVVVGDGVLGIEFDGAGVVLDGPGQVALGRAGDAASRIVPY